MTDYLSEEGIAVEGDSVSLSRCLHLVNTGIGFSGSPAKSHVSNTALIFGEDITCKIVLRMPMCLHMCNCAYYNGSVCLAQY